MKKKDVDELHGMKIADLTKKAEELKSKIAEALMERMTKEVKNRRIVKELRRKRAIVLSIRRAKELAERK